MNEESTLNDENGELPRFPPPKIKDYQLIKLIGEGSFGQVWLALDATDSPCALKIVYKEKSKKDLFWKEFEGVKNYLPISRSNLGLVTVLHVGKSEDESFYYYTMELADDLNNNDNQDWSNYEAKSLSSHIEMQAEPSPLNEFETIALNLSNGLAHLHENGLVHRDIKPSNVIFVNGVAKLADIGLVSFGSNASTFIGTTGYIPPEGPGSPQADVYALGKTLYELLTAKSVQFFPELPTTVFNDKNQLDQFSEYNLIISQATSPDYRDRPEDGKALEKLLTKNSKTIDNENQNNTFRHPFPFILIILFLFLSLTASYLIFLKFKEEPILPEFTFKHSRYHDISKNHLLDGIFSIKKGSFVELSCTFSDGILLKASSNVKQILHSTLFFEPKAELSIERMTLDQWIHELENLIFGNPAASFPHPVQLVRQFDENGRTLMEASFRQSLIVNGKSELMDGNKQIVSQGDGKLYWYDKNDTWLQEYQRGSLISSVNSRKDITHKFNRNPSSNESIHIINYFNGESIKTRSKPIGKSEGLQEISEHKIGDKTYLLSEKVFQLGKLISSEMIVPQEGGGRVVSRIKYPMNKKGENLYPSVETGFSIKVSAD
jgi:serine/threonine protein kinase